MTNDSYITLTEAHIKKIKDLNLDININNAAITIDGIVNAANKAIRLPLNEAVDQFCKNHLNAYNTWYDQVKNFADKHHVPVASAISIIDDVGSITDLYWASGMTSNFVLKYEADKINSIGV